MAAWTRLFLLPLAFIFFLSARATAHEPLEHPIDAGIDAVQSDSACVAFVEGMTVSDYIARCGALIQEIRNARQLCSTLGRSPAPVQSADDPNAYCVPDNMQRLDERLAAALNDRAYFWVACAHVKGASEGQMRYSLGLALKDLNEALTLKPGYAIVIRNLGVVSLNLGKYAEAEAWFRSLANMFENHDVTDGQIRALGEAEFRLGYGMALALQCSLAEADRQFNRTYRMTTVLLTEDHWIHAAAMYGQGVAAIARGELRIRIAPSEPQPRDREIRRREGLRMQAEGRNWIASALKLNNNIGLQLDERFHLTTDRVLKSCKAKWDRRDYEGS